MDDVTLHAEKALIPKNVEFGDKPTLYIVIFIENTDKG
jgi:hypothetical protein